MGGSYLDYMDVGLYVAPLRDAGILGRGLFFVMDDTQWLSMQWFGQARALGSR